MIGVSIFAAKLFIVFVFSNRIYTFNNNLVS